MAGSVLERATRIRSLAARLRAQAALTHILLYQVKLEEAARELEREAERLENTGPRGSGLQGLCAG